MILAARGVVAEPLQRVDHADHEGHALRVLGHEAPILSERALVSFARRRVVALVRARVSRAEQVGRVRAAK